MVGQLFDMETRIAPILFENAFLLGKELFSGRREFYKSLFELLSVEDGHNLSETLPSRKSLSA